MCGGSLTKCTGHQLIAVSLISRSAKSDTQLEYEYIQKLPGGGVLRIPLDLMPDDQWKQLLESCRVEPTPNYYFLVGG